MADFALEYDVPLERFSTLRVGGTARKLFRPSDEPTLRRYLQTQQRADLPVEVLGRGSNTLIMPGVIQAPVVLMSGFSSGIEIDASKGLITAQAGAALPEIARRAANAGVRGLEFLAVIPGLLGGGVVMNCGIGGPGGPCIADRLRTVEWLDATGAKHSDTTAALTVRYRSIALPHQGIVTGATLVGTPGHNPPGLHTEIEHLRTTRRARQPRTRRTSGSVWLPVHGRPAGAVIDELGLRGFMVGRSSISNDHANWITTRPGCQSDEVIRLIHEIERHVLARTGRILERELRTLPGVWPGLNWERVTGNSHGP